MKRNKHLVVQPHHIRYADDLKGEWKVSVYKGEHMLLTFMNRRKNVSLGFIIALNEWMGRNVENVVDLNGYDAKQ